MIVVGKFTNLVDTVADIIESNKLMCGKDVTENLDQFTMYLTYALKPMSMF
jgi:hypothetical protein